MVSLFLGYEILYIAELVSLSKINIIRVMRNTLNFHISINIFAKVVLRFGALERLLHDFSRSTLIFQSLFPIIR